MSACKPLPTVAELKAQYKEAGWDCLNGMIDELVETCLSPAVDMRKAASGVYTSIPCGYYFAPYAEKMAVYMPEGGTSVDMALCKAAVDRAGYGLLDRAMEPDDLISGNFVKVAFSPTLNTAAKALNFLPGKYPGGIPNAPSPIAASLTTGLLGAGLGYGAGYLGEKILPDEWRKKNLRYVMAGIGGLAGAVPGAVWGGWNVAGGKPYNSATLQNLKTHPETGKPIEVPKHSFDPAQRAQHERQAFTDAGKAGGDYHEANEALNVSLGSQYTEASRQVAQKFASWIDDLSGEEAFLVKHAYGDTLGGGPLDINVDSMGNVLWDVGATPGEAAMTMGALHAAQQMPGGRNEPGWVTPRQMAGLAASMGVGYGSGALVGTALGLLTGMPSSTQNTLKQTGMYLGVVKSVVPKLFGQ